MGMQEDIEVICRKNHFMRYNHIKLTEMAPDWAVCELTLVEESLNPLGVAHGGVLYSMADCATGIAARSDGRRYVTLSSSFNFLRSGQAGDTVRAEAKVRRRGRSTCYVDLDITDSQGKLLCSGNFTFFCIDEH